MSEFITDWDTDKIKAEFENLPGGSLVARIGDRLMVGNVRDIKHEYEPRYEPSFYRGGFLANYITDARNTLVVDLAMRGDKKCALLTIVDGTREDNLAVANNPDDHPAKTVKAALKWLTAHGYTVSR